jgi:MFS family permease
MVGQLSVAVTVLGSREIVRRLLAPEGPPFPQNFAYLFGIAGVIFVIAGFALSNIKEEKHAEAQRPGPTLREFMPFLGTILRTDKEFRNFARTRVLFDMATMAIPFYIIFGETMLKLNSENVVGDSILAITIGNAIGSLIFGWFSHRSGSRTVIRVMGFAILLHPLLALSSAFLGVPALYAVFLVLGIAMTGVAPGYFDWVIIHSPPDRRPIYLGLTNTISAISNLAPTFGGIVLAALLGIFVPGTAYMILFILAAVMAMAGLISSLSLVEPRNQPKNDSEVIEIAPSNEVVEVTQGAK